MPRLGVPSTTDSTPRPDWDVSGEPAPYRGRQIPGPTVDLAALSRGLFNPLLNRRKRDERKALGAVAHGKMRPFRGGSGLIRYAKVVMTRKTRAGLPASAPPHGRSLIRRSFTTTPKTKGNFCSTGSIQPAWHVKRHMSGCAQLRSYPRGALSPAAVPRKLTVST